MTDNKPPEGDPPKDWAALLTSALDHSWAWYDERTKRAFLVVNYHILATAILATAYTSAIEHENYGVATALPAVGLGLTAVAFVAGLQEIQAAERARPAIIELQQHIADRLSIESFSMKRPNRPWMWPVISTFIIVMGVATLVNLGTLLLTLILFSP